MTLTNEYAGSLYDTPDQATRACLLDWLTGHGDTPIYEALEWLRENGSDEAAGEMLEMWDNVPNCSDRSEVVDAFDDLLDEYGQIIADHIKTYGRIDGWREALEGSEIPAWALQSALDYLIEETIAIDTAHGRRGQTWLAEQVGVDPRTVRRWVSGETPLKGAAATAVRAVILAEI